MRIAYATTFDARDVHNWSGTPFHMSRAFIQEGVEVDYIGSLSRKLPPFFKMKQAWNKYLLGQRESPRFNVTAAEHYSKQVAMMLEKKPVDAVVSPLINPIAYLDSKRPIILWTDAVYAALLGFYPAFAYHSAASVLQGNKITAECLSRCKLAIFSSDWAAHSALELYGTSREKVKVVPYGANIDAHPDIEEARSLIKKRDTDKIKLLFLAKSWERKGGDIAYDVAKALHEAGHPVELTIVGYTPKLDNIPPYINCLGFISKQTPEGKAKIQALLANSHFLILPSRADACPMVFAEANAFALPCLTTYVGGISTAVKDNINGMTFGLDAPISKYCDYIVNTLQQRSIYESLAMSAHHEYESRLNWRVATQQVKKWILDVS
jgi:glycosyltransferase involved in cell wall biosynthesis